MDALRRASAKRITAVMPYYGYARQDRKLASRVPIMAKLAANLITTAGANRVLTMDLHAGQIQGFFDIPVDNLFASTVLLGYIMKNFMKNGLVIVSPDVGGAERARAFARRLGDEVQIAIIDKRRPKANKAEIMHIVGEVSGCNAILLDDMVDTAGTLTKAAAALKNQGAKKVYACATHPVLSGPALKNISESPLEHMVVTDTIPIDNNKIIINGAWEKIVIVSVAHLFGEAICRIHDEDSVSSLFV